ncbi:MAG: hypothetical protein Hyperionvirus1_108 [Hyperionvirus sp.]|uniref:Uncharacterized protein n=1 Tax=Hyperionvirus sp. TaxID=2487770 RepID=A0A3G5AB43_9VIRU|nr:MAG: hypothetical protein Hyperionvirus1_108 [Hyperionvirus sp.]
MLMLPLIKNLPIDLLYLVSSYDPIMLFHLDKSSLEKYCGSGMWV